MSALYNQTNIAPGTSLFISRAEVLDGLSTLAGDLSGVNFSTFFNNPNPVVSSITVNPSGTISLPGVVRTQALNLSSVSQIFPVAGNGTQYTAIGAASATGLNAVYADFYAKNHVAQNSVTNQNADKILYSYQGVTAQSAAGVSQPLAVWNSTSPSGTQWTLANVSTINGVQPGASFNTFTSITGSNITMNGTLLAPQMTGLSSINGVIYQVPYNGSYNFSGSVTAAGNGTAQLVTSINLPASYLQPNTTYLYDVPLVLTSIPPGGPTSFVCNIGLRLGNNGQINYQIPLTIFTTTQGIQVNLTGIAQTNPITIGSQTIDLVISQQSGSPFSATWSAPSSAGGLNVYTIKPLS